MRWLSRIAIQVRMVVGRGRAERELDAELGDHLERQEAENRAAGMSAEEARDAALRLFGNPALLRDQAHATWNWNGAESAWRDLAYGIRSLRRSPGFTLIAVLVMALGIGASVALFTVVRGVLLRPLPFKDPSRLVMLYETGLREDFNTFNLVAPGMYREWRTRNRSYESLALVQNGEFAISGEGGQPAESLAGAECTWNLFSTLGVRPLLGRDFTASDDVQGASPTVILSAGLWKRRFSADSRILGQTIYLDARPYSVIGIMPAGFAFPSARIQLWTPTYQRKPERYMEQFDDHGFRVVGRLKPGVSEEQGKADLSSISRQVHDAHANQTFIFRAANSRSLMDHMVGDVRRPLYVLLAATGCVLLIACLNVANLLVARAAARRRELAIRIALGGSWLRLLRERLIESLLLCAGGGVVGVGLALGATRWLLHTREDLARAESIHVDALVVVFTMSIIALCGLFAGAISAFSATGRKTVGVLQESSRTHSGGQTRSALRRTLLTFQVGLTVVLLVGAGLLLKSYERMRGIDMGCATENVLTMHILLPGARYNSPAKIATAWDQMLERVRAIPGVSGAGFSEAVPGQGWYEDSSFQIVEHPPMPKGNSVSGLNRWADRGYFQAMGIPILRGRSFNPGLRLENADEVIISQDFAEKYFPNEDPIGKHLDTSGRRRVIVGVVGSTRFEIGEPPYPTKYYPLDSGEQNLGTLVVRSSQDVASLSLPVQRAIQSLDRDLPVSDVLTMEQLLGKSMMDQSFNTILLVGFASLSLILAAAGLFGVLSYLVAQRTGEIGIRMALGAPRTQVLRSVLLSGLRPAVFGLVLGLVTAAEASRVLREMLYETQPLDPWVFAAVSLTLLGIAVVACVFPAWRASRVDPIQALRTE